MPSEDLRRTWFLAAGAAVLLLLTWLYWPAGGTEGEPADVVRDYLEAVRDGDADRAVAIAGADPPAGESARFLPAPGPLAPEWEVTGVAETLRIDYDETDQVAIVAVSIATPDGAAADTELTLVRTGSDLPWLIEDPFVTVTIQPSALWYTDVDGAISPYLPEQEYTLLPGAHHFYAAPPVAVSVSTAPVPLLPGGTYTVPAPEVTPGDGGEKLVQSAVDDYIDDCAEIAALAVPGCPFGAEYLPDPRDEDHYFPAPRDITWTIEEYPVVTAVAQDGAILLSDRERGTATVTGRGEVEASLECPIDTGRLEVGVLPDGALRVVPAGYRFDLGDLSRDTTLWETC